MGLIPIFAYLINWGWLRIGPPYIYININPIILQFGQNSLLALRWYGLMYAVGIIVGLWAIRHYVERKGITSAAVYRILWWCIVAGLLGGRLYFVIQQPNLYQNYILQPWNIIATWEGGMAIFGAIFLLVLTLYWRGIRERINPLVLLDAGALFAPVAQSFGRIGNLINGDIIGFRTTLPWGTVYQNPQSWACLNPATCNVPVQPAAGYELLIDAALIILLFWLSHRVRRPGVLTIVYLFGYAISQFLIFFVRDNVITTFFGLDWGLKQAQWTSIVLFIVLIPLTYVVMRYWKYARPVPAGEVAATYGIPQKPQEKPEEQTVTLTEDDGSATGTAETETEDARAGEHEPEVAKAESESEAQPVKADAGAETQS